MTIKVISDAPVKTREHVCVNCGYKLEFCNVDLKPHRIDCDGDAIEERGKYLTCPRKECGFRQIIDKEERRRW